MDPKTTTTTPVNPPSVGTSDAANTRSLAVTALEQGLAAEATKQAADTAAKADTRSKTLDTVSLDDIGDLGLGETKGLNYTEIVKGLDPEAQKIISNLRADYQRKTQALAEATKLAQKADSDRKALMDAKVYEQFDKASAFEGEMDPFDPGSVQRYIQAQIAEGMKKQLEPMHQQAAVEQRQAEINSFKAEHPDFSDHKAEMFNLMKSDPNLKLEKAYWMAKGLRADVTERTTATELSAYKEAAKSYGLKIGGANRGSATGIPDHIRAQGSIAIYEFVNAQKLKGK